MKQGLQQHCWGYWFGGRFGESNAEDLMCARPLYTPECTGPTTQPCILWFVQGPHLQRMILG